jgi:hypothetical protein
MDSESIQAIGIIGSLVVATASIIVSIWQSRLQTRALASATYSQLQGRVAAVDTLLIEHADLLAELGPQTRRGAAPELTIRFLLMDQIFTFFEEVYTQKTKYHLLDEEIWQAWVSTMRVTFDQAPYAGTHWQENRTRYPSGYRAFIDRLMQESVSERPGPDSDTAREPAP